MKLNYQAIIVGAGIAGLAAAVLLPNKVKNLSYVVYEKNYTVVNCSHRCYSHQASKCY